MTYMDQIRVVFYGHDSTKCDFIDLMVYILSRDEYIIILRYNITKCIPYESALHFT
jgi:hypothetical protein